MKTSGILRGIAQKIEEKGWATGGVGHGPIF